MAQNLGLFIPSHTSLGSHPKLLKLAKKLNVSKVTAVGHLNYLWWWAMVYAQDGDVSGFDQDDLAIAGQWEGESDMFVNALIDCGFIEDGMLHDWTDYGGRVLRDKQSTRERQARWRENHPDKPLRNRYVTVTSRESNRSHNTTQDKTTEKKPPSEVKKSAKGFRLPDDYALDQKHRDKAHEMGLNNGQVEREWEKFTNYWWSSASKNAVKTNWYQAWIVWLGNVNDFAPRSNGRHSGGMKQTVNFSEMVRQRDENVIDVEGRTR